MFQIEKIHPTTAISCALSTDFLGNAHNYPQANPSVSIVDVDDDYDDDDDGSIRYYHPIRGTKFVTGPIIQRRIDFWIDRYSFYERLSYILNWW